MPKVYIMVLTHHALSFCYILKVKYMDIVFIVYMSLKLVFIVINKHDNSIQEIVLV